MRNKTIFNLRKISYCIALGLVISSQAARADGEEPADYTFTDAIKAGKNLTNFRLRYENVSQDGNAPGITPAQPLKNANALTLRSLIGWQTAPYNNFSFAAQLINVSKLDSDFNDSTPLSGPLNSASNQPNKLAYAKVVDPDYTGINQLYIDWTGIRDTKLRLGRQQVNLDNVRFIGDIGFRQDMQVFDGASVLNKTITNTDVYLAHYEAVRQINTQLRTGGALEVLNIKYNITPTESLVGYGYFSGFDELGFGNAWFGAGTLNNGTKPNISANQSNKILGLRLDGAHPVNTDFKVLYTAEYANQSHYDSGDSRINAHYYKLGGGVGYDSFTIRADQELLSSNNGEYAFQTPFGTNHLFQGWVDKFLTTPKEGIQDSFITAAYKFKDFVFSAEYHLFNSDTDFHKVTGGTGDKYGTEFDAAVAYNYSKNITTKVEYGDFSESDQYQPTATVSQTSRFRDTKKVWLTAMYTF
jgi:hypothetical protein